MSPCVWELSLQSEFGEVLAYPHSPYGCIPKCDHCKWNAYHWNNNIKVSSKLRPLSFELSSKRYVPNIKGICTFQYHLHRLPLSQNMQAWVLRFSKYRYQEPHFQTNMYRWIHTYMHTYISYHIISYHTIYIMYTCIVCKLTLCVSVCLLQVHSSLLHHVHCYIQVIWKAIWKIFFHSFDSLNTKSDTNVLSL